ncbi:heterokaryon incompatibility protein-domain-containing protein, partial [Coniochaeta sp. 2T2.1]
MESCLTVMKIPEWCAICHNLDVDCPFPGSKGWHNQVGYLKQLEFYLPALALSASTGCGICDGLGRRPLWVEMYKQSFSKIPSIEPVVKESLLFHTSHIVLGNQLSHLPVKRPISVAGWSPESLRFIRRTLKACVQEHGVCTSSSTHHPTRLLHIDGESLRLVDEGLPHPVSYTALSYCWGTTEPLATLSTNINEMRSGIPLSKLPRTIKDAIQVTKFLGIQYLWVDALCIIQDDKIDWARESAAMAGIYGNAYVTIAAASASSADEGFLHGR